MPTELSAIIGDAIHNLRAALDLLACELVRLNGGSDEDVYFPFAADAIAFERKLKKSHIDRAGPAVVEHMKGLRAYKGGNVPLRALHDLDIADKHQMLLPVAEYANFGDASFGGIAVISVGLGVHLGPVQEGFTLFRFPTDPKLRVGQIIKTKYKLTLGPLLPLSTEDLVSAINALAKLVTDIIDSFETLRRLSAHQQVRNDAARRSEPYRHAGGGHLHAQRGRGPRVGQRRLAR